MNSTESITDFVSSLDRNDIYRLRLNGFDDSNASITNLYSSLSGGRANMQIFNSAFEKIGQGTNIDNPDDPNPPYQFLPLNNLVSGDTYYIRVYQANLEDSADYTLNIDM